MENKYYTPEISEFHVGFECEIHIRKKEDDALSDEWKPITIGENGRLPEMNLISNFIKNPPMIQDSMKLFRVKYLDKKDIESLGWKFKDKINSQVDYYWSKDDKHSIVHTHTRNRILLTIRDDARETDYTAFVGIIKNKSELKKIMNQTLING